MKSKSRSAKKSVHAKAPKPASVEARSDQILAYAQALQGTTHDWMDVFNAVFSPSGLFMRLFPTLEERLQFGKTAQRKTLFQLLRELRSEHGDRTVPEGRESTASGSFLVRVPPALHAALVVEAEQQGVSLNQLVTTKLAVQLGEAVGQRVSA